MVDTNKREKKIGSYESGTIVAEFKNLAGEKRYVFEFYEPKNMFHIFSDANLIIENNDNDNV